MKITRLHTFLAATAAVLMTLTACGSTDDSEARPSEQATQTTIDHQFGQTRIDGTPKRVVTVSGAAWSDALVRLQVPITGEFVTQGFAGPNNRFEWTPEHESAVTTVPVEVGVPSSEQIAALKPDVILTGYLPDKAAYERLSRIAPTVPAMGNGAVMDSWQDVTNTAGRIFGKQTEAKSAVDEVEKLLADTRQKFPNAQGKTFAFGQLTPNPQFGVVTSPDDPASKLLKSVGLELSPAVRDQSKDAQRVLVSPERIDLLRADVLVFWPLVGGPETFESIGGWSNLPAVQAGTTVFLNNSNASAFGTPTIYSVPWAVNKLTPALEKLK